MDAVADDTISGVHRVPVRDRDRAGATRRTLLVAAADQFYAAGYNAASLTEIVSNAGVTKGALYFHFPHKRALADAVIAEMNVTWAAMVAEITGRGLDPLSALLAESDQVVWNLVNDPFVRGGTRLLRDPLLRSAHSADLAALRYRYSESAVAVQLEAAADAGSLRPEIDERRRAELARATIAEITGHHLICDLTGRHADLWDRVTAMWQHLLPVIAAEPWLEQWRRADWPNRPRPADPSSP